MLRKIIKTNDAKTTLIIRLLVGVVFLSEGIQKFLFPAIRGAGRFEKIGLPSPEFLGSFVGSFEVLCGTLILIGFLTRLAVIPTITIMLVAIVTTKLENLPMKASGVCFMQPAPTGPCCWAVFSCSSVAEGIGQWITGG